MLIEQGSWLKRAESFGETDFLCLAGKLDVLGFSEDQLAGKVLVVGPGPLFPERLLLCTPESEYRKLRSNIDSATLCDFSERFSACALTPNYWLDHPLTEISAGYGLKPDSRVVNYHLDDVRSFLTKYPHATFNLMTFFCIPDIKEELGGDLGCLVREHLQSAGYLIGSGLFSDRTVNFSPSFTIEKAVELNGPKNSILTVNGLSNLGFVARIA